MGRPYRSLVRDEQAGATRSAILAAFVEQLDRERDGKLSIPTAAARAGVSVRTVYHHFPTRHSQLVALAAWADDELGPLPGIDGTGDLPDHVRRVFGRAGGRQDLARALQFGGAADDSRTRRLRARRHEIAALLAGIGAPAASTALATAVVSLLASGEAAIPLVDVHGLTMEEAGEASASAVAAIIGDLRSQRRADESDGMR